MDRRSEMEQDEHNSFVAKNCSTALLMFVADEHVLCVEKSARALECGFQGTLTMTGEGYSQIV